MTNSAHILSHANKPIWHMYKWALQVQFFLVYFVFGVVRVFVNSHHPSFASAYKSLDPTKFQYKSLTPFGALFIRFLVSVFFVQHNNNNNNWTEQTKRIPSDCCQHILITLFVTINKMHRELIRSDSQGIPVDDDCVYNIFFHSFFVSDNNIEREKQINHVRAVHAKWIKINNET